MRTARNDSSLLVMAQNKISFQQINTINRKRQQIGPIALQVDMLLARLNTVGLRSAQQARALQTELFDIRTQLKNCLDSSSDNDVSRTSHCSSSSFNLLVSSMSDDLELGRMALHRLEAGLEKILKYYGNGRAYNIERQMKEINYQNKKTSTPINDIRQSNMFHKSHLSNQHVILGKSSFVSYESKYHSPSPQLFKTTDQAWWLKVDRKNPKYRRFANILHPSKPIKRTNNPRQKAEFAWIFKKAVFRR